MTETKETKETRVTKTVISGIETSRVQGGTLQGGLKATLSFTVACNMEDKKSGTFYQVEDLTVTFDNVLLQNIVANALANRKVQWQPSMRENPERVKELSGKTVRFDEPLFADLAKKARTVTVARPPTPEEQAAYVAALSPVRKLELAISAMKAAGMDAELVEAELEALRETEGN